MTNTGDEAQVEVEADHLILRSATGRRQGWDEQFQRMAEHGNDKLLDDWDLLLTQWQEKDGEW